MVRRYLRAFALALLMAVVIGKVAPHLMDTVIPSPCANYSPDDWFWWWFYGCEKDAGGGGGSGAGL